MVSPEQEFVRRAGFVLMAELAVHYKRAPDEAFLPFFPLIKQYAADELNLVKKAVSWALRQIGKRNSHLRTVAEDWAQAIKQMDSQAARWIANDALRELQKRTLWLSYVSNKAESQRLHSSMVDQILFHALEKGEQFSLLLCRHIANPIAYVDEEVGNPSKKAFVKGIPKQ
jgi:hypothetical protein